MDEIVHRVIRFDRFLLDLMRGCVRSGDQDIELRPKTFEVLHHLVANAGRLVPKEEFFEAVWPNVTVGDDSLVQCIRELREKLGDDEHRLIKTVSRRGYLLDATVTAPAESAEAHTRPARPRAQHAQPAWSRLSPRLSKGVQWIRAELATVLQVTRGMRRLTLAAALSVLACAGAAGLYLLARSATRPDIGGKAVAKAAATAAFSTFKDCDLCPEMVALPAGEFMMGSPEDEPYRQQVEGLPRRVIIAKPFAIGKFEVTVAQFEAFLAESQIAAGNKCRIHVSIEVAPPPWGPPEASFRQPGYDVTDLKPVSCVSLHAAQAYVAWLKRRTGRPYRLPTESEWEYAARAGTTTAYSFGNDVSQLCAYARFADLGSPFGWRSGGCRSDIATKGPIQVGSLRPNPWGLSDMHGNVYEWVEDCWTPRASEIPTDGSPFTRPGHCELGVLRGGSWPSPSARLRSAFRLPGFAALELPVQGFRVALSLDTP